MKKIYILDTNILLDDPKSIYGFDDNIVVLAEATIEELDNLKKGKTEKNIMARKVIRELNKLRKKGNLAKGININENDCGTFKIESDYRYIDLPDGWDKTKPDNRILQIAKGLKQHNNVIIITKDMNMKIKADILEIKVEEYNNEKKDETYTGRKEIYIEEKYIDEGFNNGIINIESLSMIYNEEGEKEEDINFYPNEYILVKNMENTKSLMGKIDKDIKYIEIIKEELHPYGITGKNIGQKFIIDALMRDANDIPLVIIQGTSGTGKDFVTLACGLEQTYNTPNKYRKILITREIETLGKDIGTLPGTEEEKLGPFLRGFIDNLESLVDSNKEERYKNEKELKGKVQYLFDTGVITAEAIAYMRGRSIEKQYIIIDEAQNCTINQMKGILTRIGEGTKVILLGDIKQIDNVYLNEQTNGLTWASELMKKSPYACQITLKDNESVRSKLVKDILGRLKEKEETI